MGLDRVRAAAGCANRGGLERVLQLAQVAGPFGGLDRAARAGRQRQRRQAVTADSGGAEMVDEMGHVAPALDESREPDGNHFETIEKIFAEPPLRDRGAQIVVGCGHDA